LVKKENPKYLAKYQKQCEKILSEPEIRFAGIVSEMGKLIAGGFKKGIVPLEDDSERQKLFMELALRVATRREFDSSMGRVKYSAARREKVVMMSFPLKNCILMVVAEPQVNIDRLAYRIIKKLDQQWYEFFGK
jgi:predicted regulator of Ras-like GTPase activity (Roadblock/LC7/MglB family)